MLPDAYIGQPSGLITNEFQDPSGKDCNADGFDPQKTRISKQSTSHVNKDARCKQSYGAPQINEVPIGGIINHDYLNGYEKTKENYYEQDYSLNPHERQQNGEKYNRTHLSKHRNQSVDRAGLYNKEGNNMGRESPVEKDGKKKKSNSDKKDKKRGQSSEVASTKWRGGNILPSDNRTHYMDQELNPHEKSVFDTYKPKEIPAQAIKNSSIDIVNEQSRMMNPHADSKQQQFQKNPPHKMIQEPYHQNAVKTFPDKHEKPHATFQNPVAFPSPSPVEYFYRGDYHLHQDKIGSGKEHKPVTKRKQAVPYQQNEKSHTYNDLVFRSNEDEIACKDKPPKHADLISFPKTRNKYFHTDPAYNDRSLKDNPITLIEKNPLLGIFLLLKKKRNNYNKS